MSLTAGNVNGAGLKLRGRPWSNDEENQLRQLIKEGKNFDEISIIMGKSRLSVKGKLFNSGLNRVEVATHAQRAVATTIATTTSPRKDIADSLTAPMPTVDDAAGDKVSNITQSNTCSVSEPYEFKSLKESRLEKDRPLIG